MPSSYAEFLVESPNALMQRLRGFDDTNVFALIDYQALTAQQQQEFDDGRWGKTVNLYGDLEGTDIALLGPRLIRLSNQNQAPVIEQAFISRSTSFLLGKCDLAELFAHLEVIREVMVPDQIHALFRYQDVHVTSALFPIIKPEQGSQILGPLAIWAVLDACNRLHVLSATGKKATSGYLQFDQKSVDALDEQLFVYTVAAQVRDVDSTLLGALTQCEIQTRLRQSIQKAKAIGLEQRSDLSLFCVFGFQFPTGFEKEAPFAEAIRYREHGQVSFGAALDDVSPEIWNAWDERLGKGE